MNRTLLAALALSLPAAALAQTAPAAQPAPPPVQLATTATVTQASLSLAAALRVAQLTVQNCARQGYNVAATVVDRAGITLAVARAENAGPHTVDASYRKAYTSASARNLTSALAQNLANTPTLADIPGFLILAGGVPVRVNNVVVGAVGVGGAPSGLTDEKCAVDALTAVLGR
ncbi:heme-binding protein [Deinococcus sp. NW-56]|uniref:GlcG/HbpS family heme-binding protein n=1 Tax=Deinococcus sp. NW-56 TaxID=2080419 RepID=UPI000CF4A057|nr:heme-binding protein [Deinococcus sp. NW-56]